ncbi:9753_t:CDS:2 [Cetraspora pellucida]|uniref:9753_t:CDS:1 n=1 Tax=Cetraspora pellucida TaxID=1433469 RepID=A0ACA9KLL3_9GLOM|nr:9753_t:CDS:2 [Cetraspora pellucida]
MGETDMLSAQFTSAYTYLNKHSNIKLSDEIKLKLYGTYKAATIGTCNAPKPSLLDFRGRAKWDSWNELGEISKEDAKQRYIDILEQAKVGWSKDHVDNEESSSDDDGNDKIDNETKAIPQDRWTYVSTLSYEEEATTNDSDDVFSYAKQGKSSEISGILESGEANVNAKDDQGLSLLHWACDRGHLDVVKLLVEKGADMNVLTTGNETPLHYACISEHLDCARYLYKNGANILLKDEDGLTAFEHCSIEFKQLIIQE